MLSILSIVSFFLIAVFTHGFNANLNGRIGGVRLGMQAEKAKVKIMLSGKSASSALFRSAMKKEVVFYRGCAASFKLVSGGKKAEVVAEGKKAQLDKVLKWLGDLSLPTDERKPNFQGPSLIVDTDAVTWQDFEGDLKGFMTAEDVPSLTEGMDAVDDDGVVGGRFEVKNMAGTDESV
jgi:hypothetical protein